MAELLKIVFFRIWWTFDAGEPFGFSACYHWFNLMEGLIWMIFSALVFLRFFQFRRSRIELCYCALFAAFGASDFVEAWQQSSSLIWLKLFNLSGLAWTRAYVMRRYYPAAYVY